MRGIIALILVLSVMTGGCSLFLVEDTEDKICIPKSKLDELGISVDQLVSDNNVRGAQGNLDSVLKPEVDPIKNDDKSFSDSSASSDDDSETDDSGQDSVDDLNDDSKQGSDDSDDVADDNIPVKTFTAGDLVKIEPKAASDDITFTFSKPLDAKGEWQTAEKDAGEYVVDITATNKAGSVTKQLKIVVLAKNKAPVIEIAPLTLTAGDAIALSPKVTDADNDEVTVSYSGWMTEAARKTVAADIGTHTVTITASDGTTSVKKDVIITVLKANQKPTLSDIDPITITEGQMLSVNAKAVDPDGDVVKITFSEPLDAQGKWQTTSGDAGSFTVTVTASDGKLEDKKTFAVTVKSANKAPVIEHATPVQISVVAGQSATITLRPTVSDEDGDEVAVSYSGFMTSTTKTVTETDAGTHTVTITATDGKVEVSKTVTVVVEVNSPPDFTL